jgi:hypothetical protein
VQHTHTLFFSSFILPNGIGTTWLQQADHGENDKMLTPTAIPKWSGGKASSGEAETNFSRGNAFYSIWGKKSQIFQHLPSFVTAGETDKPHKSRIVGIPPCSFPNDCKPDMEQQPEALLVRARTF